MVSQQNDNPPRGLSVEVHTALEAALRFYASTGSVEALNALTAMVQTAGRDARARELRSDELLLVFKSIEHKLGIGDHERFEKTGVGHPENAISRSRLVRAMLEAYYAD